MSDRSSRGGPAAALRSGARDERGSVLVVTAFAVAGLVGVVALAVDLGMLQTARAEAQRAADSGAMAGAARYMATYGDEDAARQEAIRFAEMHRVRGRAVDLSDADVDVVEEEDRVRVRVALDVETIFARILGVERVRVDADGAAEARPAGGATCPLPIAVVDRWNDLDADGRWDPDDETYIPCPGDGCTSYSDPEDRGLLLEIKTNPGSDDGGQGGGQGGGGTQVVQSCEAVDNPAWHCYFRTNPPSGGGSGGASELKTMVNGCGDSPETVALNDDIWAASGIGNKQTVVQEIKNYIDRNDPDAYWDATGGADGHGCVKKPHLQDCLEGTPRLRAVPLIDPSSVGESGSNTVANTSHLAMVFLEKVASGPDQPHGGGPAGQWNVYVRFAGGAGARPGGDFENSLARAIQLVE